MENFTAIKRVFFKGRRQCYYWQMVKTAMIISTVTIVITS